MEIRTKMEQNWIESQRKSWPGGWKSSKTRVLEASWPQEGAQTQKSAKTLVRWTPWAFQVGSQNPTKIVKKRIQSLSFFKTFFGSVFLNNLMATWCQLGSQNLPKIKPSRFPRDVQQASRQNKQNVHGASARARFSMVQGSQVGTKIHPKSVKKRSETER